MSPEPAVTDHKTEYIVRAGGSSEVRNRAVTAMNRFGFVQLDDVMPREFVEQLGRSYARDYGLLDGGREALRWKVGNRRFLTPIELAGDFNDRRLYANSSILPIVHGLLGSTAVLHSVGVACALPGSEAQHVHVDHPPLFDVPQLSQLLPCYALTAVVPLVDLDVTIGTTAVWPGSHRSSLRATAEEPRRGEPILPHPTMGSVYMMDYRLLHGGTSNNSDRARPILYLVYSRPWFVDYTNPAVRPKAMMSETDLAAVPQDLKSLFARS